VDLTSWPKKWNDASLRQIATLPEFSRSRPWPLLGMLALGVVAGAAIGGYATSRRSLRGRLANYVHRMGDELAGIDSVEPLKTVATATPSHSNHRRKAAART
jgi:hypothetical protein